MKINKDTNSEQAIPKELTRRVPHNKVKKWMRAHPDDDMRLALFRDVLERRKDKHRNSGAGSIDKYAEVSNKYYEDADDLGVSYDDDYRPNLETWRIRGHDKAVRAYDAIPDNDENKMDAATMENGNLISHNRSLIDRAGKTIKHKLPIKEAHNMNSIAQDAGELGGDSAIQVPITLINKMKDNIDYYNELANKQKK